MTPQVQNHPMPTYESNPLENLKIDSQDADEVIDLDDPDPASSLTRVEQLIRTAPAGRSFLIRFPPASGDGRETLFQPLGRMLLGERREGRLSSCLPSPEGTGFYLVVAEN